MKIVTTRKNPFSIFTFSLVIKILGAVFVMTQAVTVLAQQDLGNSQNDNNNNNNNLRKTVLDEVVVTARYREENLQDTPLAITAINADELDIRGISSSADVGLAIPNAAFRPAQAAFGSTMTAFIRGIGQSDFDFAFEPGVGVYIDDVYYPTTMGSMMDLMDLERVEVLRGPQGTLFGRGSIGGAIRMVSRKPSGDNSGNIQLTMGDFERVDVRASYDFALSDTVYARVSGMSKTREGYQDVIDFACAYPALAGSIPARTQNRNGDCKLGTQGGQDVTGFRGTVRWAFAGDSDFTLTYDYQDDNSEARADALIGVNTTNAAAYNAFAMTTFGVAFDERFIPPNPYQTYATYDDPLVGLSFDPLTSIKNEGVSAKLDFALAEDHGLAFILSQREFHGQFATDADGSPLNIQMVDGFQDFEYSTAELRFSGRLSDALEYTVGLFTYDGEVVSAQTVSSPPFFLSIGVPYPTAHNGVLVNGRNANDAENRSAFAHVVYDLNPAFSISTGVRWSDDSKFSNFDNTIVQSKVDTSEDRVDWKISFDYRLTDNVLIYQSNASGYRPEAYNPRPFQVTQFFSVDGEEAVSYEIGAKMDLLDNTLRLNTALFYVDYKQRITPQGGTECRVDANGNYITVPSGTAGAITDSLGNICTATISLTRYVNTPGKIKGVELESTWSPVAGLTLSAIAGYIDWESPDITDASVADTPGYVPSYNWSLSGAYDLWLDNGAQVTPRIDIYGQDKICTGAGTASCAGKYTLINAGLQWVSGDSAWHAMLGVSNAADKEYFYNIFDLTAFGQPTTEGQPARPREWYLTLRRDFN